MIPLMAKAISATSAEGETFGKLISEFNKRGFNYEDTAKGLEILNQQGQAGSFELKQMAQQSEKIFSTFKPDNLYDIRVMGAVLQIFKDATGVAEQTVTAAKRFVSLLTTATKIRKIQDGGAQVLDPEAAKRGELQHLDFDVVLRNIAKASGGNEIEVSSMIPDELPRSGLATFLDEYKKTGKTDRLDNLINVTTDQDGLGRDAADNRREINAGARSILELAKATSANFFIRRANQYQAALAGRPGILDKLLGNDGLESSKSSRPSDDGPPIDLGGTLKIEINQKGRVNVQQVESNDPRMKIEVKQNTGTRMVGD